MDKRKQEAMVTKFLEKLAIIMLKKHRKFCRCGLTHLDATPTFKNCPNTYAPPCTFCGYWIYQAKILRLHKTNTQRKYAITWLYNSTVQQSSKIQRSLKTEKPEIKLTLSSKYNIFEKPFQQVLCSRKKIQMSLQKLM